MGRTKNDLWREADPDDRLRRAVGSSWRSPREAARRRPWLSQGPRFTQADGSTRRSGPATVARGRRHGARARNPRTSLHACHAQAGTRPCGGKEAPSPVTEAGDGLPRPKAVSGTGGPPASSSRAGARTPRAAGWASTRGARDGRAGPSLAGSRTSVLVHCSYPASSRASARTQNRTCPRRSRGSGPAAARAASTRGSTSPAGCRQCRSRRPLRRCRASRRTRW